MAYHSIPCHSPLFSSLGQDLVCDRRRTRRKKTRRRFGNGPWRGNLHDMKVVIAGEIIYKAACLVQRWESKRTPNRTMFASFRKVFLIFSWCQKMTSDQGCDSRLVKLSFDWQHGLVPLFQVRMRRCSKMLESRLSGSLSLVSIPPDGCASYISYSKSPWFQGVHYRTPFVQIFGYPFISQLYDIICAWYSHLSIIY